MSGMAKSSTKELQWLQYFKIGISRNIKCDSLVGFPKSGHTVYICTQLLSLPATIMFWAMCNQSMYY